MHDITRADVQTAISGFLNDQFLKKAEPDLKRLEKAEADQDEAAIASAQEALAQWRHKYSAPIWLEDAAQRMASQLKFGTHISKGIHPDAKGDNVNFSTDTPLPEYLIGSQSARALALDANGNAAALPLAAFFNTPVGAAQTVKLRQLIAQNHPALNGCFADEPALSDEYQTQFQAALSGATDAPTTHERNKQILWPRGEQAIVHDDYICLVPLYPSALTHAVYQQINQARYSEENKLARDNRFKKTAEHKPYVSITQLAMTKLGGTKPQNVSQLTSAQGGRNYLLPNLPPKFQSSKAFKISAVAVTIFNKRLRYHSYRGWLEFDEVIKAKKSVMAVRDQRKLALQMILAEVFQIAERIQTQWPAGWSRDYQLSMAEKYWLDPDRADLEGEEAFKAACDAGDWAGEVIRSFALWLNQWLKETHTAIAEDFDEAEESEWRRAMASALRTSQRRFGRIYA